MTLMYIYLEHTLYITKQDMWETGDSYAINGILQ